MLPKSIYSDTSYKAKVVRSIMHELNIMSNGKPYLFDIPCLTNYRDCELSFLKRVLQVCVWFRKLGFKHPDPLSRVHVLSNGFLLNHKRIYYARQYDSDGTYLFDSFVCVSSLDAFVSSRLNEGFSFQFFPVCSTIPNK